MFFLYCCSSNKTISTSENNIFKTNNCLEDSTIHHWYNNGKPANEIWGSRRTVFGMQLHIKFYSMLDPFTETLGKFVYTLHSSIL